MMRSLLVIGLVVLGTVGAAWAQEVQAPPGYHTHDGFLLRLMPGFGGGAAVTDTTLGELSISGGGVTGSLALGFALNPRLALTVETAILFTVDPTIELDGQSAEATDSEFGIQYVGVGASYYTRGNFFVHGGAGAVWLTARDPGDEETSTSDTGVALRAALGQEWWVTDNWGVGAALSLVAGSISDGDLDWGVALVGLHLSATYN